MWIRVVERGTGKEINNAVFPAWNFENRRNGWYFIYLPGLPAASDVNAPGFVTLPAFVVNDTSTKTVFLERPATNSRRGNRRGW